MRTRTIFEAFLRQQEFFVDHIVRGSRRVKEERKLNCFYLELLRRMDERDALVAKTKTGRATAQEIANVAKWLEGNGL